MKSKVSKIFNVLSMASFVIGSSSAYASQYQKIAQLKLKNLQLPIPITVPIENKAIFSIRPGEKPFQIVLVELKTPALLTSVTKKIDEKTGKKIFEISAEQKKELEDEQEQFLQQLTAEFPRIKVLERYKHVINAFALYVPKADLASFPHWERVSYIEIAHNFSRPEMKDVSKKLTNEELSADLKEKNSVSHMGSLQALKDLGLDGAGLKVGVIDTGVDYLHEMFGGPGDVALYKSLDRSMGNQYFPSARVVGGKDFVGFDYDSNSFDEQKHIPKSDPNPIDDGTHGTHVAGSIAGRGDGVHSYDGVAPKADIYALKVFVPMDQQVTFQLLQRWNMQWIPMETEIFQIV